MGGELWITLAILLSAMIMFLSGRLPLALVSLMVMVALGFTRVLTPQEAFSGLSDPAVVIIIAIFVLTAGLDQSGVTERIGKSLLHIAGGNESRLILAFMISGAALSLTMNNIAAASLLLPAASTAADKSKVHLSRLLMPIGFSALLGGMATLFTTTNIVVSGVLRKAGYHGFGVLDFIPVGLPLAIAGIAFMALLGRRLLPEAGPEGRAEAFRKIDADLLSTYGLGRRLFRAKIPTGSPLIGSTLAESAFRDKYAAIIVAIEHEGRTDYAPSADAVFRNNDILLLKGRIDEFQQRNIQPALELLPTVAFEDSAFESENHVVVELMLAPRSRLIGSTLHQLNFRDKYGMQVLAIWRKDRSIRTHLRNMPLEFGDTLLVHGPRRWIKMLSSDPDLILLSRELKTRPTSPEKAWLASIIFAGTILIAAISPFSVPEVMLSGALLMILARIVSMEQVYRAIDWTVIFLVAGMLPLGAAMIKTGATKLIADALISAIGSFGPTVLLLALLAVTTIMAQTIKGAAVSAVMAPIAITAAKGMGLDPRSLAMGVALATSMAFITPLGHPVNILMMGAGGYTFRDYFRVGLPLTLVLFAITLLLLPVFWPLTQH
jgi:di/tricarboxylate transporter